MSALDLRCRWTIDRHGHVPSGAIGAALAMAAARDARAQARIDARAARRSRLAARLRSWFTVAVRERAAQ